MIRRRKFGFERFELFHGERINFIKLNGNRNLKQRYILKGANVSRYIQQF